MAAKPRKRRRSKGGSRTLALDSSSVCCGWAIFHADGTLDQHGRLLQLGKGHGERMLNFLEWIKLMIARGKVTNVLCEEPYSGRNRNAFKVLSKYVAVIEMAHFFAFGVEIPLENRMRPKDVKRLLKVKKGKDHEQNKKIMVLEMNRVHKLSLKYKADDRTKKVSQDDEADAIALGTAWFGLTK